MHCRHRASRISEVGKNCHFQYIQTSKFYAKQGDFMYGSKIGIFWPILMKFGPMCTILRSASSIMLRKSTNLAYLLPKMPSAMSEICEICLFLLYFRRMVWRIEAIFLTFSHHNWTCRPQDNGHRSKFHQNRSRNADFRAIYEISLIFIEFWRLYVLKKALLTTFRNPRCAVPKWPQNLKIRHFPVSIYVRKSPCNESVGWLNFLIFEHLLLRPNEQPLSLKSFLYIIHILCKLDR